MLTFEQIKDLIDQVASHRLAGIELERSGFRLKIDGQQAASAQAVPPTQEPVVAVPAEAVASVVPVAVPEAPAPASAPPAEPPKAPAKNLHVLNSPIVGTFYRSPNPDSSAFAEVGDRVQAGQVLCIVEAMKLMNEIESDVDGEVVEIYIENAQAVEYGEPLFGIKVG